MHSCGLHSPNISFPAVTQKGVCSDCIVHSFAFHCDLNEMQILVDMRYMTSNLHGPAMVPSARPMGLLRPLLQRRARQCRQQLQRVLFGNLKMGGSETQFAVDTYYDKQRLRVWQHGWGLPIAPRPCYIIVDQYEELLKRFPEDALRWANSP